MGVRRGVLVILALLTAACNASSGRVKGPPVAERGEERHVAREGEEVKLKCPIQGHPAPMVTWSRAGEEIDFSWTRFRASRRVLRIRGVERSDRGVYTCKGINGFGSAEVGLELLVVGREELEGLEPGQLERLAPPAFLRGRGPGEEVVPGGQEVVLDCRVTGYPEPAVVWRRAGALLREGGARLAVPGAEEGTEYSCRAANLVGRAERAWVVGPPAPPTAPPARLQVEEGQAATLDCRVRAAILPKIRWLKKLEQEEDGALTVGRDFYRMLETAGETVAEGPGSYLSQLVLRDTVPEDAGMYICFVTSPRGRFNFQPSFLTVRRGGVATEDGAGGEDTTLLVLGICISVLVTLAIVGAAACLVQKRGKVPASPPASVTISTSASTSPERVTGKRLASPRGEEERAAGQAARLETLLRPEAQPLQPGYCIQPGEFLAQEYHGYRGEHEYPEYPGEAHNLYEVPGRGGRSHYSHYSAARHQPTYARRQQL
jgi:hypothetical protein